MKNAALIDICGTLFYSNTTFDFLDYYIKDPKYIRLRKKMKNPIFLKTNNIIYRIFKYDYFRSNAISYLKGIRKDTLKEMAEEFYDSYLSKRKNEKIWNIIASIEEQKIPIILISGTISPIAEIVANDMNCLEISSPLEFKNNICTGKIKKDNLRNKAKALKEKNINPPYSIVITDNIADSKLFKHAKECIIICYGNRKKWNFALNKYHTKISFYEENNSTFIR